MFPRPGRRAKCEKLKEYRPECSGCCLHAKMRKEIYNFSNCSKLLQGSIDQEIALILY